MEQSLEQSVAKLADSVLQLANAIQFLAKQEANAIDFLAMKDEIIKEPTDD